MAIGNDNEIPKRERVKKHFTGESKTKQSFGHEANINNIMDKYKDTGLITHVMGAAPRYGDFSLAPTYQESLNQIKVAEELFMALPAKVRKDFDNDPVKFVDFASDPENFDKMVEYGLANRPETEPVPEPVPEPPPEPATA